MDIIFLGTASAHPSPSRGVSGTVLRSGKTLIALLLCYKQIDTAPNKLDLQPRGRVAVLTPTELP